jgi:phospholipid/cholesterol/gamma-HCH transport system substrate-binding protein
MTSRIRVIAVTAAGLIALSGCGFKGAYSLPLPGGAAHGKTYHVTAIFSDVQDLTVQAAVRVNDVAVGDVTGIKIGTTPGSPGYLKANVDMSVNESTHLPANAVATLEQTTLLGEKFIALSPPTGTAPEGNLATRTTPIDASETSELPSTEEVFGLLSQVLNGSDLADLQTINIEVSKALAGRETAVRGALTQLNTFVSGLNAQKQEIVRALDELDRFSTALKDQNATIATALTDLGPGLRVLADERAQFTKLLTDLSTFGDVATHVIKSSKNQTIVALRDLQPILGHLAAAGKALPRSLEVLFTFPFPRDSSQASPGDYTNAQAAVDLTPIVCLALDNLGLAGATDLINHNPLISQLLGPDILSQILGGQGCPTSGSVNSTQTGSRSSTSSGGKTTTGSTTTGPTGTTGATGTDGGTSTPTPTPSPTDTGLARLLNGLLGGDNG